MTRIRQFTLWASSVALVGLMRLWCLDADPSPTMPDASVMDEGLWADSARGLAVGMGCFADDLGNAYLIAPLYTWLLAGVYWLLGVGLWQTRLLSALMSIATAALAGRYVAGRTSERSGAAVTLMLGLCPLLDQHGRFALLESTQAFFILFSFTMLFPLRPCGWKAVLAGAAMGGAMLVKPNSISLGVWPLLLTFLLAWSRRARNAPGSVDRRFLRDGICAALGGAIVLGGLGLPVWLAHWTEFVATVRHESGSDNWTLADHLLQLGLVFSREKQPGEHAIWGLARGAPLCAVATWLLLLRTAAGGRWRTMANERDLWCWLLIATTIAELSFDHVARRQVLFLAPMACLSVQALRQPADLEPARPWPRLWTWLLLLLPVFVLLKPTVANAIGDGLRSAGLTAAPTATGGLGGWISLIGMLLVAAALAVAGLEPTRWLRRMLRLAPMLLLALAISESARLGALPPHAYSLRQAQDLMAGRVQPGAIVLGEHAATIFQTAPVRTVRRVIAGRQRSSPRPNPDVAERLQPRYVLDYTDPALRQFADVTSRGFHSVARAGFLLEVAGNPRFDVELWERN